MEQPSLTLPLHKKSRILLSQLSRKLRSQNLDGECVAFEPRYRKLLLLRLPQLKHLLLLQFLRTPLLLIRIQERQPLMGARRNQLLCHHQERREAKMLSLLVTFYQIPLAPRAKNQTSWRTTHETCTRNHSTDS